MNAYPDPANPDRDYPIPMPPQPSNWPDGGSGGSDGGNPPPAPPPSRMSLPFGRAPRLLVRYALAWGVVGWACYWIDDAHIVVPGLAVAAMACNPWRPKRPAHPWSTALRAAFHPGTGALRRSRRPVTPLTPAA